MQLAEDTDAGGLAQSPEPGGGLPPQAQTGLPAAAADLADIAPAPPPEIPLLQAAYGDKGAEQYQALRDAGRAAPMPMPAADEGPVGGIAGAPSAGGIGNLLGAGLAGLATHDPMAGAKMAAQRQQMQLKMQAEFRQNASEFYTALLPAAFKQFPGRPDLAAAFLMNQARQRGLLVDPAVLIKLNQDITDGKLTEKTIDEIIGDPNTPMSMIERLGSHAKFADDLAKGRAEAESAIAAANVAPQKQAESLRGEKLTNDMKQMDVDTFYDSLERRITAEAQQRGLKPGTPQFTDYTEKRKVQMETWAKRQAFLNTPLSGRSAEDFNQADRAGKFATEALRLLNDPSIQQNRGVLEGRLRNLAWRFGFAQSSTEDLYQSLSNLSGLMASKVYSGGIRNMKWIDRVMEHTLRPGDELPLLRDKVNVLLRAAREQQQGIINTAGTPIGKLTPTVQAPTGELAPTPGGLSPAGQDYLSTVSGAGAPPAP